MRRALLASLVLAGPALAHDPPAPAAENAASEAEQPARNPALLGDACSFTTGMVARRVLSEGDAWTFTGFLVPAERAPDAHVASPFAVGPDEDVFVVANEVVDTLVGNGLSAARLTLEGRRLELDHTAYFVPTGYARAAE